MSADGKGDLLADLSWEIYLNRLSIPVLEKLAKRHGELRTWYKEHKTAIFEEDDETKSIIGYSEVDWFLFGKTLAKLDINRQEIRYTAYNLNNVISVEYLYDVHTDFGQYLKLKEVMIKTIKQDIFLRCSDEDSFSRFEQFVSILE